jgi:diguanylate cyclase (GGDEF)-like protein
MFTVVERFLSGNDAEALRRQVYLLAAAVAGLSQATVVGLELMRGVGVHWEDVFGTVVCIAMIPPLMKRSIPIRYVNNGVLLAASLGVLSTLFGSFIQAGSPPMKVYIGVVMMFLISFIILPAAYAALYSLVLFTIFVALLLTKGGDATVLIDMGVVFMLIAYLSIFGQRISAERAAAKAMQDLASTDTLTGLANRRAMYVKVEQAFTHATNNGHSALLLLDIDHFKNINDSYGHMVGDQVLQRFASVLQRSARSQDSVSRWGGEEFLVLLANVDESEAVECAHRFLQEIRTAEMCPGLQVTASCGVAHASNVNSMEAWLVQADERLYSAKNAGRDRVRPQGGACPNSTGGA